MSVGTPTDLVGRSANDFATDDVPFSYVGIELGQGRRLVPSAYTLRNCKSIQLPKFFSWRFEGSIDMVNWVLLD